MPRVKIRLDPIERDIEVMFNETLSPQARSRYLAEYACTELRSAQDTNRMLIGTTPRHETYVDGKHNAPIDSVRPDGVIAFEFHLLDDLFKFIGDLLIEHSPVGRDSDDRPGHPGLYRASHIFSADLTVIEPGDPVPEAREYVFTNAVPYARKIERGLSDQAPSGVYEVVAKMAADRFGNVANIRFSYREPLFGGIHTWADTTSMPSPYRRGEKRETWLRRQPAIVMTAGK